MQISYGFSLVNAPSGQQGTWKANNGVNGITDQFIELSTDLAWTWGFGVPLVSRGRNVGDQISVSQQFGPTVFTANVDVAPNMTNTPVTIWTPTADRRFVLMGFSLTYSLTRGTSAAAVNFSLLDESGSTIWGLNAPAGTTLTTTVIPQVDFGEGYIAQSANASLQGQIPFDAVNVISGGVLISVWGVQI
jgi:hypothetical protein